MHAMRSAASGKGSSVAQRKRPRTWVELIVSTLVATGIALAASASPIGAAKTFVVDTTTDSIDAVPGNEVCADAGGACSLRAAVMEANALPGVDTITPAAERYTLTLTGTEAGLDARVGDLDVTESLTLSGAGRGLTTIVGAEGLTDRLLEVQSTSNLALFVAGVTLTGGRADSRGGGGLRFEAVTSSLVLEDVRLVDNETSGAGAAGRRRVRARSRVHARTSSSKTTSRAATAAACTSTRHREPRPHERPRSSSSQTRRGQTA